MSLELTQLEMDLLFHERFKPIPQKRKDWDTYFLDLADMVATRATCLRAHHGAVLVDKYHRVIATGYNGSDPGADHCEDVGCLLENGHCVRTKGHHAEDNAIDQLMEMAYCIEYSDLVLYVTANPCSLCHKRIESVKEIDCVVYRNSYYDGRFRPIGIHKLFP